MLVCGTEGDGLAHGAVARVGYTVRIPMAGGVDSLNGAAASAGAFWQLRAETPRHGSCGANSPRRQLRGFAPAGARIRPGGSTDSPGRSTDLRL